MAVDSRPMRFGSHSFAMYRQELKEPLTNKEWRTLVKVAHPDKGGNAEAFEIVQRLKPGDPQ